jgi:uncharacterized protein YqgC (DUF456 family)
MDIFLMIAGCIMILVGIAGSVLPILPGPAICYAALWLQQWRENRPFTTKFLLVWGGVIVVVLLLDYLVPVLGTKKFGGSKYGVWGCGLGFLAAFWMGPWGIIFGPLIGAFIGEMIHSNQTHTALKAALGSFLGFLISSLLKLMACIVMGYYLALSIWQTI